MSRSSSFIGGLMLRIPCGISTTSVTVPASRSRMRCITVAPRYGSKADHAQVVILCGLHHSVSHSLKVDDIALTAMQKKPARIQSRYGT